MLKKERLEAFLAEAGHRGLPEDTKERVETCRSPWLAGEELDFSWFTASELESLFFPSDLWRFFYHRNPDSIVVSHSCLQWSDPKNTKEEERCERDSARKALILSLSHDLVTFLRTIGEKASDISQAIMLLHDKDIPTTVRDSALGYRLSEKKCARFVEELRAVGSDERFGTYFEQFPFEDVKPLWEKSLVLGFRHYSGGLYTLTQGPIDSAEELISVSDSLRE